MTGPLAIELKKQGHFVTGSDQEKIYSPMKELLENISINNIDLDNSFDLVIVGSSYKKFKKTIDDFETTKKLNIPYVSATEYIDKNIIKENSILIAGTYGKTTITSLTAWTLNQAKINPSYMFGGIANNNFPSCTITNSPYSVVEADESINGLDKKAKFLYYKVKYLLISSADWEHKESYLSEEDNLKAFKLLIEKVPQDGFIILNSTGTNLQILAKYAKAPVFYYQKSNENGVRLLCQKLNIDQNIIEESIKTFHGIKRREELVLQKNNITIIDDFAQSGNRIKYTLENIKNKYQGNIKVLFEAHASFLQNKEVINDLKNALNLSQNIVLTKLKINKEKEKRITAADYLSVFGNKLIYLPQTKDIINYYQKNLKPNDILVHFSSGGLEGQELLNQICQNI